MTPPLYILLETLINCSTLESSVILYLNGYNSYYGNNTVIGLTACQHSKMPNKTHLSNVFLFRAWIHSCYPYILNKDIFITAAVLPKEQWKDWITTWNFIHYETTLKNIFQKNDRETIKPINLCPSTVNIIVFSLKLCKIAKYYPCKGCKFIQANADALACADLIKNWYSISVAYRFSSSGTKI